MRGLWLAILVGGCAGGEEPPADDSAVDSGGDSDVPKDTGPQLPTDPAPFTVEIGGGWTGTMVLDSPTCINYPQGSLVSFRQFWRGSHNGLLVVDVIGTFEGAGTYDLSNSSLRVLLQSEAGNEYNLALSADDSQGDTASLRVDHISSIAWGEATVSGMHGSVDGADVGAVTVTSPIPIYCPTVTTQ